MCDGMYVQLSKQMVSGAVVKMNNPGQAGFEQPFSLTWTHYFFSFYLRHYFSACLSHCHFPYSGQQFPWFLPPLGKTKHTNAMESSGEGVSQQGQNQTGSHAQICPACKSNWGAAQLLLVPHARPFTNGKDHICQSSGPQLENRTTAHLPPAARFIHLCQISNHSDKWSRCTVWQWVGFRRWVKMRTKLVWDFFFPTHFENDVSKKNWGSSPYFEKCL